MNRENTTYVWDPLVRLFHWSLVALFIACYFSSEEENIIHIYTGYGVLGLLCFRVIWGFIGTRHARFSDFIFGPATTLAYARSLFSGKPLHYTGHNPLGGWMVMALLASLLLVTVSGLKVYAIEEGLGPLATEMTLTPLEYAHASSGKKHGGHDDGEESEEDESAEEFWEEIHEVSTNFTLLLIFLHLVGVVVSSRLHGENLVRAMITGRKQKSD